MLSRDPCRASTRTLNLAIRSGGAAHAEPVRHALTRATNRSAGVLLGAKRMTASAKTTAVTITSTQIAMTSTQGPNVESMPSTLIPAFARKLRVIPADPSLR